MFQRLSWIFVVWWHTLGDEVVWFVRASFLEVFRSFDLDGVANYKRCHCVITETQTIQGALFNPGSRSVWNSHVSTIYKAKVALSQASWSQSRDSSLSISSSLSSWVPWAHTEHAIILGRVGNACYSRPAQLEASSFSSLCDAQRASST